MSYSRYPVKNVFMHLLAPVRCTVYQLTMPGWVCGYQCDDEAVSWAANSTELATVQMAGIAMPNAAHKHAVLVQQRAVCDRHRAAGGQAWGPETPELNYQGDR